MVGMFRRYILISVALIGFVGSAFSATYAQQSGLATMTLEVVSKTGTHKFLVELAVTPQEQATGMMFRRSVDPDKGMFFIYSEPDRKGFWMKNTLIPLDIIYVRADGRIINIIRNAEPKSLSPRRSRGPVLAVLEIAGGRAKELGIRPGDRVIHSIFKSEQE